jgi:hypothetical protein
MKKSFFLSSGLGISLAIASCQTYTIPVDSFKNQIKNANSSTMKEVTVNNPLTSGSITYQANNIERIVVVDKNGTEAYLENSGSIELRVTHKNGKKFQMYFDTVILENDTLKGGRSRFIQSLEQQIPIDSIVKIEIQNGGKDFKYRN